MVDPATVAESSQREQGVLIVDDERGPRESLRYALKPHFRVLVAEGGERALEVLEREPLDVVTLDLKMPGLSGEDTLCGIRERDPDLQVVIVTGYGSYESAVTALRLRAFDYITKPFDPTRIIHVVRRAAEFRRARQHGIARVHPEVLIDDIGREARSHLSTFDRVALDRIRLRLHGLRQQLAEDAGAGGEPASGWPKIHPADDEEAK